MKIIDIFRIAFSTFRNNKMRTFLTIFGVSIGIGAIVFLFSLGYGLQKITIGEITSIKALTAYNVVTGNSSILKLDKDVASKLKQINNVASVDLGISLSGQIFLDKTQTDLVANAAGAEFIDLESPRLEVGDLYKNDTDKKIVITSSIAQAFGLSPSEILGKNLKLVVYDVASKTQNPTPITETFSVVGVIKDTSASYAYIPIDSILIPRDANYTTAKVKVSDSKYMQYVKNELTKMGYQSSSVGEKVAQLNKIFNIAQIALIILGAVALLVASIGMFNTLTISLLERTKDIGIMKALGATDREIYLVFLTESSLISSVGGIMGLTLAFVLGTTLNIVVSLLAKSAGAEAVKLVQVPLYFAGIVILFSFLIGFLTGLYPSRRAAKLNPLDALRYE